MPTRTAEARWCWHSCFPAAHGPVPGASGSASTPSRRNGLWRCLATGARWLTLQCAGARRHRPRRKRPAGRTCRRRGLRRSTVRRRHQRIRAHASGDERQPWRRCGHRPVRWRTADPGLCRHRQHRRQPDRQRGLARPGFAPWHRRRAFSQGPCVRLPAGRGAASAALQRWFAVALEPARLSWSDPAPSSHHRHAAASGLLPRPRRRHRACAQPGGPVADPIATTGEAELLEQLRRENESLRAELEETNQGYWPSMRNSTPRPSNYARHRN